MWLRDSANQLQSYKPILHIASHNDTNNIAKLYRGTINLQARYIRKFPYCNAFQPPPDSKLPLNNHKRNLLAKRADTVNPPYDPSVVWECKYELDSVSAFLQLSWDYYDVTKDADFFGKYGWADAVKTTLSLANDMMMGTYADDGQVNKSPYTWLRDSNSATETVSNGGSGNPVAGGTGLVRSFFRPSDDSTIYQYFIPANMMFSRFLKACAEIMQTMDQDTASEMRQMAQGIDDAIDKYGIAKHPTFGDIYAYEVDGFGSHNFMVSPLCFPSTTRQAWQVTQLTAAHRTMPTSPRC
jgi:meiotically up-regulated gene 157 (Mug157) protein